MVVDLQNVMFCQMRPFLYLWLKTSYSNKTKFLSSSSRLISQMLQLINMYRRRVRCSCTITLQEQIETGITASRLQCGLMRVLQFVATASRINVRVSIATPATYVYIRR